MSLRCERVLITGGSRGIGFAIADRLAREGAQVVITGRDQARLDEALRRLPEGSAHGIVQNIANCSAMNGVVEEAASLMSGLDTLVNNAGMMAGYYFEWGQGLLELTPERWDAVMNVNARGTFFMMQAAVSYFLAHEIRGNILNISSEAGFVPATGPYGASKHAVRALTSGWAAMFAEKGIIVNSIAPGTTETDFVDVALENSMHRQKNGRLAKPEEIAALAAWMLSEENVNMIGQTILTCGGSTIL